MTAAETSSSSDKFQRFFPKLDAWDKAKLTQIYHQYDGKNARKVAILLSFAGDPRLWIPALLIVLIINAIMSDFSLFIIMTTGFLQSFVIYYILKHYIKRPRPFRQFESVTRLDKTGHGYSFPSGHAHHSTILFGVLWLYLYPAPWVILLLFTYNFAVGYSRIISGVHFPIDTVVGILEGYLALFFHWFVTKELYLLVVKNAVIWICTTFNLCLILFP